jgi:hypothetical protein
MSIEHISLIDESKDVSFIKDSSIDPSDLPDQDPLNLSNEYSEGLNTKDKATDNNSEVELTNNDSKTESTKSKTMITYEHKMQKFMSMHMNELLSDLKENIVNSSDLKEKEELEKAYQNEVNYKLEVDSLIHKLEKDLYIKDESSIVNEVESKKRSVDEEVSDNNKKTKK